MTMNLRDQELVALIARSALKDEAAFKELYDRVSAYLNSVALRIVKSPETSNDVLQEAFVQIWQNAASYRPHLAKPLTWLTSIVRYRALDRLDKDKRLSNREIEGNDWLEELAHDRNPEMDAGENQQVGFLLDCMSALSDRAKQAITLAYIYGYSRDEIAIQLKANTSTVKSWLRRGTEKLRQCLKLKLAEG